MTTGEQTAVEPGRLGRTSARSQAHRSFAMLGLFAALSYSATADAQTVQQEPRTPIAVPPPAAPVQSAPVQSAPTTSTATGTAQDTRSTTTTTSTVTPPAPTTQPVVPAAAQPAAPASMEQGAPAQEGEAEGKEGYLRPEEKREISNKLISLDQRLEHVDAQRAERGKIAGPISMLTAGFATGFAALAVSLTGFVAAEASQDADDYRKRLDINGDDRLDADDTNTFQRISRGFGVLSAVGFGVGIAGSVFLAQRLKERRQLDPDVRKLQRERKQLREQLDYGANVSRGGLTFALSGRF